MDKFIQEYFELVEIAHKNRNTSRKLNLLKMRLDWEALGEPTPPVQDMSCASCVFRFIDRIYDRCRNYLDSNSKPDVRKSDKGNKRNAGNAVRGKRRNNRTNSNKRSSRD